MNLSKSSKGTRMLEIIEEAKAEGRKVIIFSFYLDVIEKISEVTCKSVHGTDQWFGDTE